MEKNITADIQFLRHTIATLAYRGGKAIRNVPEEFSLFKAHANAKSPINIIAHINDLLDWTLHLMKGKSVWKNSRPKTWAYEAERFHKGLQKIDDVLASGKELKCPAEKIFQGPVADALTHVGQIAYLRRLAGLGVMGENYYAADITAGNVGENQAKPKIEFN